MASKRIATTDRSGLSVAQVGGNDVYKLLPQVQSVIELGNLGNEYVKLFAEPVDNGRSIDWYVEEGGNAVPLANLEAAQKKALLDRLGEMVAKLQTYAASLRKNSSATYRNYADIVEKALIVPDMDKSLYAVDGEPVLANWGFSAGDNDIVDGVQALIQDIQDRLEKIRDINKNAMDSSRADSPDKAVAEEEPVQPAPEATGEPGAPASDSVSADFQSPVSQQVQASGGAGSWIAAAVTGAALLAAGGWAVWHFMHDEPGVEDVGEKASMAWLKGDLDARGVFIDDNNEPVDLTLRFTGEDGKGTAIIRSLKQICTGEVVATPQSNNRVAFATGTLTCPDGHNYEPFTMSCVRGGSKCSGLNHNGESWELDVNLLGNK